MNRILLILFLCVVGFSSAAYAQGIVRGNVSDETGETLIGVTIILKANKTIGVVTDLDGNYSLKVADSIPQILVISYMGFQSVEQTVNPKKGEVVIKNFVLKSDAKALETVEVTAKAVKTNNSYMENMKKNSAASIDYISAETMKKTGDNNVTAAVARVSGVSTNGSFITVRGIGDRYIKTTINGSQIPTLDPFTNNIKLDMFPASLVDNIIITKTASPDLPGDWSGAYISVETKDYPDQLAVNVESSFGYNQQTTFKNVLTTQTSSTDWLGYDNGYREQDHQNFVEVIPDPNQYEQLVALGLSDYYKSLGVTKPWEINTTAGNTYFHLGLVELGYLEKAHINDPQAIAEAKSKFFNGSQYNNEAYEIINANAAKSGQAFPNNWNTYYKKAPINFSQSFSIGNQIMLFGRPLGFIAGFRYSNNIQNDPNSVANRTILSEVDSNGNPLVNTAMNQHYIKYTNGWSALANIAYKYSNNHSISLLFMPNFNGVNNIRDGIDTTKNSLYPFAYTKGVFYEERKQMVYQLKSEHYLEAIKTKVDLNVSYTRGNSSVPDFKNLDYFRDDLGNYLFDKTLSDVRRNYRYLEENILDSKLNIEIPLSNKPALPRKIKFGGAYQKIDKKFDQYDYLLRSSPGSTNQIPDNDLEAYFTPDRFGIGTSNFNGPHQSIDLYFEEFENPSNHTIGYSKVMAGYAMIDYTIIPSLRATGGIRIEQTDIFTDVFLFDSLGLSANDERRIATGQSFMVNPGSLYQTNYLPSINLIYKLGKNEFAPMNIRANYSKSVARPSIREYSETIMRDFEQNADVFGNADLKMVQISNYDIRFEKYFESGNNFSVSGFYKDLKNHIELVTSTIGLTWANAEKSKLYGIELEGRIKIIKGLEFRANVSFVNSQTDVIEKQLSIVNGIKTYIPLDTLSRNMFGQAPYVLNGILSYTADSIGFTVTLSYNVQGPRLVITSAGKVPDVYEMPRHLFDLKLSKKLGKHFNVSFTVRDLLNSTIRNAYKYDQGYILDYDRYRYGTNYQLSISYKL